MKLHGNYHSVYEYTAPFTAHENKFAVVLASRPPAFFEKHVKNLCLMGAMSNDHALRVLSVCTGVRNLAFWGRSFHTSPLIVKLRLRSLDTTIAIVNQLSKLHHMFPDLTYLSALCRADKEVMSSLEWLPALTHVRLVVGRYNYLTPAIIRVVAQTSRRLQSILIQIDNHHQWYFNRAQVEAWAGEDSRVMILEDSSNYGSVRDWEERISCHNNGV